MIYVVLGMHKSGTTLVARILHHSGINMIAQDSDISYDHGNQYERRSTLDMNVALLKHQSYYGITFAPTPADITPTTTQVEQMQAIVNQCQQNYSDWGFKDPRSCLTYPVWTPYLPPHTLILVYRDLREIWPRFRYNGWRLAHTNFERAWRFVYSWCEYNGKAMQAIKQTSYPFVVLSYRHLMGSEAELARLQALVDRPLNDQRQKSLYRNQPQNDWRLRLAMWIVKRRTGYDALALMDELDQLRQP